MLVFVLGGSDLGSWFGIGKERRDDAKSGPDVEVPCSRIMVCVCVLAGCMMWGAGYL